MFRIPWRRTNPKAWAIMAAPKKKSDLPTPKSTKKISRKESKRALIMTRKSNALRPQQATSQMLRLKWILMIQSSLKMTDPKMASDWPEPQASESPKAKKSDVK